MSEQYAVFDIECIGDPENPPDPPKNPEQFDRVPAAAHHVIVSCAILMFSWRQDGAYSYLQASTPRLLGDAAGSERSIVEAFSRFMGREPLLVSWNGRGFDLPVLTARSFRWGVQAPWMCRKDYTDRYRGNGHIDLQEHLTNYGAGRASKMAAFARLAGWPGKLGVSGADVPELWASGDDDKIRVRRYNLEDVGCEGAILLRWMYSKGDLTLEQYRRSAASLLEAYDKEPRFAELSAAINRDQFLLNWMAEEQQPQPPVQPSA